MLKDRIQEVFEFTKSESPYRKANKGWINQDVFLDLGASVDTLNQKNEAAKVTLFWSPINSLLSNIFIIIVLGAIFVFTSVSFAKGRFDMNLFNNSLINDIDNKSINMDSFNDLESTNSNEYEESEKEDLTEASESISQSEIFMNKDDLLTNKITYKIDTLANESESNKDIKNLQNIKRKSNLISTNFLISIKILWFFKNCFIS